MRFSLPFKVKDFYFKKAKQEKFVARSVYKLEEIDQKYNLLKGASLIIDLGYHPGSWIQYAQKKCPQAQIIGIDIREKNKTLESAKNVTLFEKDIFTIDAPEDLGLTRKVDVLLSDMAPNTTGIKSVDQDRSLELVEKVFSLMNVLLRKGGNCTIKVFDGHDAQVFLKSQKNRFENFHFLRPKSTRSVSKEFFVIGLGLK